MYEYIGDRIRKIRELQGLSQKTLGIMLGLSDKAISSYESGRTVPPFETLYKIAKELKKPLSYFVEASDDETSLYDRLDRTEKSIHNLIDDLREIKEMVKKLESKKQDPITKEAK